MNIKITEETNKIIATLKEDRAALCRPTLCLHVCCAPCGSYSFEYLSKYFDITAYFYNPNIKPPDEYHRRLSEVSRLITEMPLKTPVKLVEAPYNPHEFDEIACDYLNEPEGGKRCERCINLRIFKTAEFARENGFDYFSTTLSISPHKNAALIYEISKDAEKIYGVKTLPLDLKKNNGYKRSIELSKEYSLYRQSYCGCTMQKISENQIKVDRR
jgi:predicted adenine nucleotide alpha hydrolase (AANH) superfamily ATPase